MSGEYYRAAEVDAIAADIIALQAENAKLRSERVAEEVGVLHKRIAELEEENMAMEKRIAALCAQIGEMVAEANAP